MDYNGIQKKIFVSYSDLDRAKMRALEKIIRRSPVLPIIIVDNPEAMTSLSDKIIEGIESADYGNHIKMEISRVSNGSLKQDRTFAEKATLS